MRKIISIILLVNCFATSIKAANADTLYVNPNPCDSFTTIHFTISQSDTISLNVYNRWGQLLENSFQNTFLPAGTYAINYITDSLPNDSYIVHLKINSESKIARFIKNKNALGISETKYATNKINAFPNPTADKLTIEYLGIKHILLIDLEGKIIYKSATNLNVINLENISIGTYVLQVTNDKNELILNQKIIKTE